MSSFREPPAGDASAWTLAMVEARLRAGLQHLPGPAAQALLAPRPRRGWHPSPADTRRQAAALILLYPRDGRPHLVLTVRASDLAHHGGQVSLPGGAIEPGEAVASAALREAAEEIGIDPAAVRLVGPLTPLHIPVSDFLVHPIVGILDCTPVFAHSAVEVARVLEVPLDELLDKSRRRTTTRTRDGQLVDVPYLVVDGEMLWGATAMMLAEFICAIGERAVLE